MPAGRKDKFETLRDTGGGVTVARKDSTAGDIIRSERQNWEGVDARLTAEQQRQGRKDIPDPAERRRITNSLTAQTGAGFAKDVYSGDAPFLKHTIVNKGKF